MHFMSLFLLTSPEYFLGLSLLLLLLFLVTPILGKGLAIVLSSEELL